jgi:hypothetical protein
MSDVTYLVLGVLVLIVIPALYFGNKAKEAQEKAKKKETALQRKVRNRKRNKRKK